MNVRNADGLPAAVCRCGETRLAAEPVSRQNPIGLRVPGLRRNLRLIPRSRTATKKGDRVVLPTLLLGTTVGALSVAGWFSVRYAWWKPPIDWRYPRILMYHMVREHRPGTRFNKLRVTPRAFAEQLRWLTGERFQFLFASELFRNRELPERSVCLTFDDGYADNLAEADPLLEQYGARATLFLVSDRGGGWSSLKKSHHSDEELQSEPKLTDDQVRSMLASGRWELGGHTRTHANLAALSPEEARPEIVGATQDFPRIFGQPVPTFAYPFGIYGRDHTAMVREAGFAGAFTTEPGISRWPFADSWEVPRIKVAGNDSLTAFRMRIRTGKRGLFS